MGLTRTSVSENAYASCSQSGVKRIKGSQVTFNPEGEAEEADPQLGVVAVLVGLRALVVVGVVAEVGVGAEVVADSELTPRCLC